MGLFDPVSVDTQRDNERLEMAMAAEPVKRRPNLFNQATVGDLYIFLLKFTVAGFLVWLPIALIIWLVNYAATH